MYSCKKKEDYSACFGGQIANPHTRYVLFSKGNKVIDTLRLDKNNCFFVKFDSLTPGLYSFKHDPKYQYIYFDRNDSLMVSVNAADFNRTVVYTGRGSRKNNFFTELFTAQETDRHDTYGIYSLEPAAFTHIIDSAFALREAFYKKNKQEIKWGEGFDTFANLRLVLNYYTKKEYYPYVYNLRTGKNIVAKLPKNYYDFRSTINFNDARLVGYAPYLRYLTAMVTNLAMTHSMQNPNVEKNAFKDNITKLTIADSIFTNKAVKNEVLSALAFNYLLEDQNMYNNQKFLDKYAQLTTDNTNSNEIHKISQSIKELKVGSKLPAMSLVNAQDKAIDLNSNISKKTVLFFWTSCAHQHTAHIFEKVNALKEKHPDVEFIAINVDSDTEWKKAFAKLILNNVLNLRSTDFTELRDKWVITKINRTIVLNADGTINNAFTNLLDDNFEQSL